MNFFFYIPGHARSLVQWGRWSPQSAAVSQPVPKSFLWASTGLGHFWRLKALKVGQNCRMWLGVWGPVPHGHSSEWEIFSLWRWERSWQCPVLSLKTVTWAALYSWWMLSSSVPMSRHCQRSPLCPEIVSKYGLCFAVGHGGVQIAPVCFPFLTADLLPHCLQHHSEKGSTGGSQMFCS